MRISDVSIRNPVFAWMLMAGLIIFGAISFSRMGVSQLPDVDFPNLNVSVSLEGAAPEVMERLLSILSKMLFLLSKGFAQSIRPVRQAQLTSPSSSS